MLVTYAQALIVGFAISVPVGPASLLCMQRTLMLGRVAGLVTGLGVATADVVIAIVVAGGFSTAADFLVAQARPLTLGAGILLVVLGIRMLRVPTGIRAGKETSEISGATWRWSFLTGFLLTMANPMAVLMMIAALALMGFVESGIGLRSAVLLVAGIFSGSLLWWTALVAGVSTIQRQIPPVIVGWINRTAGLIFVVLGTIAFGRGLM